VIDEMIRHVKHWWTEEHHTDDEDRDVYPPRLYWPVAWFVVLLTVAIILQMILGA